MNSYELGDLIEVRSNAFAGGEGWHLAIVVKVKTHHGENNFAALINPTESMRKYQAEHLARQNGLWAFSPSIDWARPITDPTDEQIALQTAFLLTGQLPDFVNYT